ncbi:MAG: hypothetical protein ACFFDN_41070 [Candidatus Hodarchaeota archaeon]
MENKYIEDQIHKILVYLDEWKELFNIKLDYYEEGWAISLREKNIYPRYIVIFKPFELEMYSLKSFEIHFNKNNDECFNEIYYKTNIYKINELLNEIKEIIYGKDIADKISRDIPR